jgi:hypothetical protein
VHRRGRPPFDVLAPGLARSPPDTAKVRPGVPSRRRYSGLVQVKNRRLAPHGRLRRGYRPSNKQFLRTTRKVRNPFGYFRQRLNHQASGCDINTKLCADRETSFGKPPTPPNYASIASAPPAYLRRRCSTLLATRCSRRAATPMDFK